MINEPKNDTQEATAVLPRLPKLRPSKWPGIRGGAFRADTRTVCRQRFFAWDDTAGWGRMRGVISSKGKARDDVFIECMVALEWIIIDLGEETTLTILRTFPTRSTIRL